MSWVLLVVELVYTVALKAAARDGCEGSTPSQVGIFYRDLAKAVYASISKVDGEIHISSSLIIPTFIGMQPNGRGDRLRIYKVEVQIFSYRLLLLHSSIGRTPDSGSGSFVWVRILLEQIWTGAKVAVRSHKTIRESSSLSLSKLFIVISLYYKYREILL